MKQNEREFADLGFGNKADQSFRLINKDGTFNIERKGLSFLHAFSFYHTLLGISWGRFFLLVLFSFLLINVFFACIYLIVGIDQLQGIKGSNFNSDFMDAYFFSTQTFTTVGYGRINPVGLAANAIASIESMFGWLYFALTTGILYGRFAKPVAKILISENAVIAPYKDITGFQFRMVNQRNNQLIEAEVRIILSMTVEINGIKKRTYDELELERGLINFLALSWTVVHPINEKSPIYKMNAEELAKKGAEFLILIKAFDDAFSQVVHTRSSYKYDEIIWGAKFVPLFNKVSSGRSEIHLDKLNAVERVELPVN